MARRANAEEDDVSLFPFLSIIAAIIGVLTLMIAAVTLDQMNQDDVKQAVENAIEMEAVQKQLAKAENEVQTLSLQLDKEQSRLLQSSNARQAELVKTRAELEALLKELTEAKKRKDEQEKIKIVIPEVPQGERESLEDLREQGANAKDRLAKLQHELDEKKKTPEEAQVTVVPGGSGLSYRPNFVECTARSIVMHTEDPPITVRTGQIAAHKKYVALMEKVANDKNQTIVFLLRSDGLNTYWHAKKLCDANDVRNGRLPAIGNGRLDFSHFRRKG